MQRTVRFASIFSVGMILCLAVYLINGFAQSASSAKRGGKPSPTPTPTPTPVCGTGGANTNSWTGSGGLDLSFGSAGFVINNFSGSDSQEIIYDVLVQSDGKILNIGEVNRPGETNSLDVLVVRYNYDGSLDTGFGRPDPANPLQRLGYQFIDFSGGYDSGKAGAIDSSGRILVAGTGGKLLRLEPDGDLDPSFGTGGRIEMGIAVGEDIALQSDGQILVTGSSGASGEASFNLIRLNADGSPDLTFGTSGFASVTLSGKRTARAYSKALAIQMIGAEERVVLGGKFQAGTKGPFSFALARIANNGSVDTSFGNNGVVLTSFNGSGNHLIKAIAVDSANRIVATGYFEGDCGRDAAFARYQPNGSLDTSFSDDGLLTIDIYGNDAMHGLALQADGKIVAVGDTGNADITNLVVVRLTADGVPDPTFGPGTPGAPGPGMVTTDSGSRDYGFGGTVIQADGKIVAAGSFSPSGSLMTRYHP